MKLSAEQKKLFDALTQLQQNACVHYLSGDNQTESYRKAGGTAKSKASAENAASKMFSNVGVRAFLDSVREAQVTDAIMSREEALETLSILARTNLTDLVEFATYELEEGVKQSAWHIPDSILQDQAKLAAISELCAGKDGIKVKQHSRLQAIKQIADMQGWDAPKRTELTGKDGKPLEFKKAQDLTDDELAAIAAGGSAGTSD